MNQAILLILAIVNFTIMALSYRMFGKTGLFVYIVVSVIAANIQVNKGVVFDFGFFQLTATLGNVMFGGIFLATDLLSEVFGKKTAGKAVIMSVFCNIAFISVMYISTLFITADYSAGYSQAIVLFFSINGGTLKAVIISNVVYLVSQIIDVHLYSWIRKKFPARKFLFLRNNGSTFLSQAVDTALISVAFALAGIFPFSLLLSVILSTLLIKYIVALLDTPFLYFMSRIKINTKRKIIKNT